MSPPRLQFLASDKELARLIKNFDWSKTDLGPIDRWPASLTAIVGFLLRSPVAMVMLWGPDGVMVYNDAYAVFAGGRHPDQLGKKVVSEGWPEVAEFNANVLRVGLTGGALTYRDQELTLFRHGRPEQVWMNLDYSPVYDDGGTPAGVMAVVIETTERVAAERQREAAKAAMRAETERVQLGLEAGAILGTWIWEVPNDRFTADERFAASFDLDTEECRAGMPFERVKESVHPDDRAIIEAAVANALRQGGRYRCEYRARHRTDGYHWVEANGHVQMAADGSPLRFPGVLIDISARRDADDAKLTSEARLRLVIEGAKDHAILTTDPAGLVTSWSGGAEAIFGWTGAEIVGQPAATTSTPEDQAAGVDQKELDTAAASGVAIDQRWHIRKDGQRVFMNGSVHPFLRGADGKPQEFLKIARDETERYRTEKALANLNATLEQRVEERTRALRDSEDFSRLAMSAVSGVGVWTYDMATDMFVGDSGIAKLYGLDPSATAAGLSPRDFLANVHPDDRVTLAAKMESGLKTPGDLELEYRLCHADGSVHWVMSRGHTYLEDGKPVRRTGVGVDTTDQRHLEEQLRQSQKMEAVGQLTGGIAHDFNNLLAGISGSLELIQKRITDLGVAGFDRHMGIAQASTQRAAALTQRLLAFSRRQTLDPKPVDVNRLIAGVEDLLRRSVGPNIEISVVGAIGLWPTKVDAVQLENALLNLVINARDAMPDGGRVIIETANKWIDGRTAKERDLAPGQYISVSVTDTGIGMPSAVIERVFDPFYTTKPLGQGTGLGLSMIHGFVRQSGGQVRAYSEVGQGTTMSLYLPRYIGDLEAKPVIEPEDALEPGQGETVLVIDDEKPIRMLMTDVLEEAGYRVLEAADGPSGLKILQSDNRIDLLISDVGLPGGYNGRQVADAARLTRPDLKVLFITGYADNAVVGNGHLETGMQVITKPFAMTALALRVREIIET